MKIKLLLFAGLLTGTMYIFSCSSGGQQEQGSDNESQGLSGKVHVDGSSTVYPITEAVAEEYRLEQPDVKVLVGLSGTGGGFKKFSRGETDINDASRPIKDSEIEACQSNGIDYIELMVAYDGLSVVANPENDWLDAITLNELKMIWEPEAQGVIMRWNQIRSEWPDEEIHLFGPGTESGTYDYFTEAIVGEAQSSRGDYTASEDDNVLVQGVSTDKYSLGFFGYAYYEENKDKLKVVGVDDENPENGDGAIYPTLETVMNKTYSPLSRPLFIYANSEAVKRSEVADFVTFYLENASTLTEEVGFIPLSPDEYMQVQSKFADFVATYSGSGAEASAE
jgi:phosphate transport system substrate-binding protein